jgi:formate dehydrogenase major subunit
MHLAQPGQTILGMLRSGAHMVPALCDDPRLVPIGGCRLSLVEVKGQARPQAACTTSLTEGMEIATHTPQIEQLRRAQLRLLAHRYPRDALARQPMNDFHRLIRIYGLENEVTGVAREGLVDDSHPAIHVDMSQCIYCFRCVRICEEVAGRFVWAEWNRGDQTQIRPAGGTNLRESACVSCGACVDTCPTGALIDKRSLQGDPPTRETRTVCSYCGTGCEIHVGSRNGRLKSVRPVLDAPVSKGHLCVKGRYGWDFVHAPDRIARPMIRHGDRWQAVTWSEAIHFVAQRLQGIIAESGPETIGVLGSARATNEDNYVAQKFARVAVGSNNVDCCARVCHAPTAAGMKLMLGTGAATNSFDDIEQARTILLCGANPTENHPIVGDRIKQITLRGTDLIVIDPRRIDLARYARLHLQLRPGTNIPLLNAMAHVIVREGLIDSAVVPAHIENWDKYLSFIDGWPPERAAEICGINAQQICQAARIYATQGPSMCIHGLGGTEHVQGTEGVVCLVNLALLTGNIGCPGSGINPLRGQNNVQGAAHMGCDPEMLTGSALLMENRQRFEAAWNLPVPATKGLNLLQMIDAAELGHFKALWAIGYDVALTNPNADVTISALKSLDFVVVQDLFLNETARLVGSVFLPACSSFEKEGTFMNSERRIQRVRKVIDPIGESKPDWTILCQVAEAMGKGEYFKFRSAEDIWNEIRTVWPAGAGITYRRLDKGGLQWPCPTDDHPGTAVLHTGILSGTNRVRLRCVDFSPTPEQTSDEFPFLLVTGRSLYQFNAGTMTARSMTGQFRPTDLLQISPGDARRLRISDGRPVRVRSRYGEALLTAEITDSVRDGELFATFQTPAVFLNRVTGPYRDGHVQTPEYKVTAVCVEPDTGG